MDCASDEHHQFQFTSDDLAKLKSVVKGKASTSLSDADVEDITSEILLSACVTAARADSTAPIAALAFTYAAMPSYYVAARRATADSAEKDPTSYEWIAPEGSNSTLSVEIRHVLLSLSPISRQVIWMCDVAGMTLAETATVLDISTSTAYRRLEEAHADFRAAWAA